MTNKSNSGRIVGINSNGSHITWIDIQFPKGDKVYRYNEDVCSQYQLQEMKYLGQKGSGLVRFMTRQGFSRLGAEVTTS